MMIPLSKIRISKLTHLSLLIGIANSDEIIKSDELLNIYIFNVNLTISRGREVGSAYR